MTENVNYYNVYAWANIPNCYEAWGAVAALIAGAGLGTALAVFLTPLVGPEVTAAADLAVGIYSIIFAAKIYSCGSGRFAHDWVSFSTNAIGASMDENCYAE